MNSYIHSTHYELECCKIKNKRNEIPINLLPSSSSKSPLPEPSPEPLEAAFTVAVVLPKVGVVRLVNAVVLSEVSAAVKASSCN